MPPKIVVVCGPTASGKTGLGIGLAQALNGEVVSADSMQIYRGMDIGTAKPTADERAAAVHHMIDVADPGEDYSVGRYVEEAGACVDDILSRGKTPVIVGGTGLYIDSLVLGRQFAPFAGEIRADLTRRMETEGGEALLAELAGIDPDRAARLHANDEKRIIRALEIFYETGKTISQHDEESKKLPPRYEAATIFLNYEDRADLWARIDQRVDEMVEEGLVDEVETLLKSGISPRTTAMQAIGYKEFSAAVRGEATVEQAIEEVKLRSRQYAKRQVTWFKKNEAALRWEWKKIPDKEAALQASTAFAKANGIG